jgi:cation:H+ antiporter
MVKRCEWAICTSLPELVTSIIAIRKGHTDIGIGTIVGSNIYNILMILGISYLNFLILIRSK